MGRPGGSPGREDGPAARDSPEIPEAVLMARRQLESRGITDSRVLAAMRAVPRHLFVPAGARGQAWGDFPLPIGHGQTISQPYIVALMTELLGLRGGEQVLEVGTGSGYQTAVLARLAARVFTVERIPALAEAARGRLAGMGVTSVEYRTGDGSEGWAEHAPYDAILVAAAAPRVPPALEEQLADGGVLVVPVGESPVSQVLVTVRRIGSRLVRGEGIGCRFVPLVGAGGHDG
jgi:protein-L-isoaspartate(D-aspartate) O-methyltransferase